MHLANSIGEPRPPLVEHQQAAELGQALDMADQQRLVPRRSEVARHAAYEDNVRASVADNLVGDRDVSATGVADVRYLHERSLSDRLRERQPCCYAVVRTG